VENVSKAYYMLKVKTEQNRDYSTARPPARFEEESLTTVQKRRKKKADLRVPADVY